MTLVSNWVEESAAEIAEKIHDAESFGEFPSADAIVEVIERRCPFKPEVTYLEAKEAETDWIHKTAALLRECASREAHVTDKEMDQYGFTLELIVAVILQSAPNVFIPKEPQEPPLLQCSHCGNTESCAGAMARFWNHGRCKFCAGYFKVVRA